MADENWDGIDDLFVFLPQGERVALSSVSLSLCPDLSSPTYLYPVVP